MDFLHGGWQVNSLKTSATAKRTVLDLFYPFRQDDFRELFAVLKCEFPNLYYSVWQNETFQANTAAKSEVADFCQAFGKIYAA